MTKLISQISITMPGELRQRLDHVRQDTGLSMRAILERGIETLEGSATPALDVAEERNLAHAHGAAEPKTDEPKDAPPDPAMPAPGSRFNPIEIMDDEEDCVVRVDGEELMEGEFYIYSGEPGQLWYLDEDGDVLPLGDVQ